MTPYSDIYAVFLTKVNDYSYLNLEESDVEDILRPYLISSIPKFKKHSRIDLTDRMDTIEQFNGTLGEDEIEILASLMLIEYLTPQIVNLELLKQALGNKEWRINSQANQLKELRELKKELRQEVERLIVDYTYDDTLGELQ